MSQIRMVIGEDGLNPAVAKWMAEKVWIEWWLFGVSGGTLESAL
jgi:hypothetical protein